MIKNHIAPHLGLAGLLACSTAQASCGSAFCTINTNWDEHSLGHQGWSGDLHYSYSHADTLRSGSKEISANTSAAGEVENVGTYNRVISATADYTYNDRWGVMVVLPFIIRDHEHNIGPYTGSTPADYESFHTSALGDAKLIGRYRWSLDSASGTGMGVKFGAKLDTGKQNDTIKQTGIIPEEVTLQTGNGSTDLILGLFWHSARPGSALSWFAQGAMQSSVKADNTFRPGNQVNIDGGMRYALNHDTSALLQLNAQWNHADSRDGAALTESGHDSSGGRSLFLTPGLSYAISHKTQIYGLVQLPIYQYVNGEQLTADSSASAGVNHRF
jgi:hypothetical protein